MSDNIDKFIDDINKRLERAQDKTVFSAVAKMASDLIKKRTRLGYGVEKDGANKTKLKGIKDKTIEQRQRKKKMGLLHNNTTPKKSNLTDTGQLIDAIGSRATQRYGEVFISEKRKDRAVNSDIVEGQSDMGRKFFNISNAEYKQLERELRKILRGRIK